MNKLAQFKNSKLAGKRGIIQILVVIIIALVLLRVLGISITALLAKPGVHDFAVYVKEMLILVWNDIKQIFFFFKTA